MSLLLEGKRAFITGGTRGIGAALCEVFAREGADIAFSYNSRDDLADEIKQKIEALGRKARSFKVSVTDRFGMKHLTRELVQEWGGMDILVNNAAINRGDNFATTTDRAWDEVIGTNVGSLFAVTKPIYKQMIRQRAGAILNITSIGAIRALPTAVHYATSKAAMIGSQSVCRARRRRLESRSMRLRRESSIRTWQALCRSVGCKCTNFGLGDWVNPLSSLSSQSLCAAIATPT